MALIKLRLGFLFTDLSQHFRMYLVVHALKFFIHGRDVKSFYKLGIENFTLPSYETP